MNCTGKYKIQMCKLNFFDRFPSVFLLKIRNEHSAMIKHCIKTNSVKSIIKDYILSKYNNTDKCNNLLCPDCNN